MSSTLAVHVTSFDRPQKHSLVTTPQTFSILKDPSSIGLYSNIFQIKSITPRGPIIPSGLEILRRPLWNPIFYDVLIKYAGIQTAQIVFTHPLGIAIVHSQDNVSPLDINMVNKG